MSLGQAEFLMDRVPSIPASPVPSLGRRESLPLTLALISSPNLACVEHHNTCGIASGGTEAYRNMAEVCVPVKQSPKCMEGKCRRLLRKHGKGMKRREKKREKKRSLGVYCSETGCAGSRHEVNVS